MTLLCTLANGDAVYRYDKRIVIRFEQPRKVLSTSILNGGYREDLRAVFNHDCSSGNDTDSTLRAPTYGEHMRLEARDLGFDPDTVAGMGTAAQMENVAVITAKYETLTVTAVVTGGVEVNGGRVGDPTTYFQPVDKAMLPKPGTINIMLVINADLPPGILARALVTCTEAKTAALQELMAGSNYSTGLATGSGTDQTIVIANPSSALYLEGAGKHSKLGELIGCAVKPAVKEALLKQTGLSPELQHSVLRRLKRFGVTEEALWEEFSQNNGNSNRHIEQQIFLDCLNKIYKDPQLVTHTSLYVHLLDQLLWGLLSGEEALLAGNALLVLVANNYGLFSPIISGRELPDFLRAWTKLLIEILKQESEIRSQESA
ncbi:MAG: adenosylcobinamide amidohydrolase [Desulfitobacteriaceae bacterium]|nr:adenosylcobinamide amidohydrolase [Desulfitobacteriaceae bacterium]